MLFDTCLKSRKYESIPNIPIKNNETLVYTIQPGETEYSISKRLLISVELLREIAPHCYKTIIVSSNNELKQIRYLVPGGEISFPLELLK